MRYTIILLIALLSLTGCRDEEAEARAAKTAKVAEEARIALEVSRRVVTQRQALADRRVMLQTIRIVGFIALTGGAVSGLIWVRQQRGSSRSGTSISVQHEMPPLANDHYPVPTGRVLDLPSPSSPSPQPWRRSHETPPRA
jgi:hypothetical protein